MSTAINEHEVATELSEKVTRGERVVWRVTWWKSGAGAGLRQVDFGDRDTARHYMAGVEAVETFYRDLKLTKVTKRGRTSKPKGEVTLAWPRDGITELRGAVNLFNTCVEEFNGKFSLRQLLELYRCYAKSGWDITPDCWTDRQVRRACVFGETPRFDEYGNPIESHPY